MGNYVAGVVRPLGRLLSWNGVDKSRMIKTKAERTEARVAASLMAFGGCEVETLGSIRQAQAR